MLRDRECCVKAVRAIGPLVLLFATSTGAVPISSGDPDVVRYVVKPRDTLWDLDRAFIVAPRTWQALLPLSGARSPRRLPIGRTLAIPRSWLRSIPDQARLVSFRGTVSIDIGGRTSPPTIGMTIGEGAHLVTGANSFVTLILADNSRVTLPSQSGVVIGAMRRLVLNGAIEYRLDLDKGRIQTHVTPLTDPSGRYRIGTPITMTAVRGTEFRVSYDPARIAAATEVLAGTVALSAKEDRRPTLVSRGFGGAVDASGHARTEALLPAPELIDPGKPQRDDAVRFRLAPMAGAVGYHILLATDAGFVDNYAEQTGPSGDFTLQNVPDGNQFVRLSAIAADGLEGLGQSYSFARQLASIHPGAVSQDADGYRFRWFGNSNGARHYRFQLVRGSERGAAVVDEVGLEREDLLVRRLRPGVYYWRVAVYRDDIANWTDFEKLTIGPPSEASHGV
jgi:hypothetical protein